MKLGPFKKPSWRAGSLARGTLAMTGGMGFRVCAQAIVFLIVARLLGVNGYGGFASILALATGLGLFAGLGGGQLLVRDVARGVLSFPVAWGQTLAALLLSIPVLLIVYFLLAWLLLPPEIPMEAVALIGMAELILAPAARFGMMAYQAHQRMGRASRLVLAPLLPRLAGALLFIPLSGFFPAHQHLLVWCTLYLGAAALSAVYAGWLVRMELGTWERVEKKAMWSSLREGFPFALGQGANKLLIDVDKALLARLADLDVTGIYSAARRITGFAMVPVRALLQTTLPRFFQHGQRGADATLRAALRILPWPLAYGAAVAAALFLGAGWVPLLLGESYAAAAEALRWLSLLPLLLILRLFVQQVLYTTGKVVTAVRFLGLVLVLNIVLNIALIPVLGWKGAVVAALVCEASLLLMMILTVSRSDRRDADLAVQHDR